MNYLKVFCKASCGYLMNILFTKKDSLLTNEIFYSLPKAQNDNHIIFSILCYKNAVTKKIIKLIKYKGDRNVTRQLSKILYDYLLEDVSEKMEMHNFTKPIIIPIPATRYRMKEHGFNQCERIANYIKEIDSANFFEVSCDVLIKTKESESQAHAKDRATRLKNIKKSFGINFAEKIHGRNIILIDDVWTTGATINEARDELLKAGAKSVIAYTIAH